MPQGNKPRFSPTGIANGIEKIYINRKYRYFVDYIYEHYNDLKGFIYRGHKLPTYKLLSTLDRRITGTGIDIRRVRKSQLNSFKKYSIGKRGIMAPQLDSDREWWALGQHYGLDTPLLDWTESPFVAAYFAFAEKKYPSKYARKSRVVYALNRIEIERYLAENNDSTIDFYSPEADGNMRIISQSGLFTISENGENLEDWVSNRFQGINNKKIIIKFYIPNSERINCLQSLDTMNINHATLFPDLYGASVYSNMKLMDFE